MAGHQPRVYVIDPPASSGRIPATGLVQTGAPPGQSKRPATTESRDGTRSRTMASRRSRLWLLAAFLFGPLAMAVMRPGRRRAPWVMACLPGLAALLVLALALPILTVWFELVRDGATSWIVLVSVASLGTALAWAVSVNAALRAIEPARWPLALRGPAAIFFAGSALPGLGLALVGARRRSAAALFAAGMCVAGAMILLGAPWIWGRIHSPIPSGLTALQAERLVVAAALVLATGALVWLAQALDGARLAVGRRSAASSGPVAALFALTLVLVATLFRPVPIASNLGDAAAALADEDMLLVPLVLSEAAGQIDPSQPVHVARSADLYARLGRADAARARQAQLSRMARDAAVAVSRAAYDRAHNASDGGALARADSSRGGIKRSPLPREWSEASLAPDGFSP